MKICENCQKEHDGTYGSGRFCSAECARGFSTKAKRSLINEVVSKKLSGRNFRYIKKICLECNKEFEVSWQYRNQKACSIKCSSLLKWKNIDYQEKIRKATIKSILNGRKGIKRAIQCKYSFKDKIIRCDSKTEYSCLNYFENNFNVLDIKRCNFTIPYIINGKNRKYLPDFIIETEDNIYIIECKAFFKITEEIKNSKSWSMYYDSIIPKKEVLEKYCLENNYKSFFYTRDLNRKYYDNLKFATT
jgi:hypothetical protein